MPSYQIQIDENIYTVLFQTLAEDGYLFLTLGPTIRDSCLNITFEQSMAIIAKIESRELCNINPPLHRHGVLDILVPLGIEIALLINKRVILNDAAVIPTNFSTVWLSLMKIMSGSKSTAYSKYGFYSQDLPQREINRQSKFFLTRTGRKTSPAFQQKLVEFDIPTDLTLNEITRELFEDQHYDEITELYTMFFPRSNPQLTLDLEAWSEYKEQHKIELLPV
jgi:hypothetical protein